MKRLLTKLAIAVLLCFQFACDNSTDSTTQAVDNPLINGTGERSLVVVISDIHLGADLQYAEINHNVAYLAKFLEAVRVSPNVKELVIAGDLLDEWFVPANIDTYKGSDQKDFVKRIASANKIVFDALNTIIQEKKILVTYVPGNHDLTITAANVEEVLPGINQARDNGKIGLGTYSPEFLPELAVEHGHRYNFFCAPDPISNQDIAPGTILPPGYFYTRLAALHVAQECTTSGDSIIKYLPNPEADLSQQLAYKYWKIWAGSVFSYPITNKFDEKIFVTNVDGFTANYSVNDFLPFQTQDGKIDMNLFKNIQDTWEQRQTENNVPIHIDCTRAIDSVGSSSETDYLSILQYFLNPNSNKRIVIFGHSHVAKIIASNNTIGNKCLYANSGTWIDVKHNGIPTTMNFVVITPQNSTETSQTYVKLFNFEGGTFNLMKADSLRI